jgi:O-antigen ligase
VEQFQNNIRSIGRIVLRVGALGILLITLIIPYPQIIATISKRINYIVDAWQMIMNNWFWGVGLGQYVANLPSGGRELWQYEPVHNIVLLLWSEIGLMGLGLLIVIMILEYYTSVYGYKK